jgi:hypothetical protein
LSIYTTQLGDWLNTLYVRSSTMWPIHTIRIFNDVEMSHAVSSENDRLHKNLLLESRFHSNNYENKLAYKTLEMQAWP